MNCSFRLDLLKKEKFVLKCLVGGKEKMKIMKFKRILLTAALTAALAVT